MKKDLWVQTFSGKSFYPFDCKLDQIDIVDIAHSLSMQCRFNGHCLYFYSIAEHSVRVARLVKLMGFSNKGCLAALLHDAAEAYMGDLVHPIKCEMYEFKKLENEILSMIHQKYLGVSIIKNNAIFKNENKMIISI